jgi:sortase A
MASELFTDSEKKFIKKITIIGLIVVCIVAVLSGIGHVLNVYNEEGQAGLNRLVKQGSTIAELPEAEKPIVNIQTAATTNTTTNMGELPLSIQAPSIGINTNIQAPTVMAVSVLDAALNKGPVYYPGSGSPGDRNMLIFGHSTGFSIVHNQAYKVFNNIKNAKVGSLIYIKTSSGTHTYKTISVKKVSKYNTWVQFDSTKPMLTLATCDSFGKASDRWVLEAEYIGFSR